MAIYDPITRQEVTIIGRYPPQQTCFKFGKRIKAAPDTSFQFLKVRYETGQPGGFPVGTERDIDVCNLVAEGGINVIHPAADAAPLLPA